MVGTCLNNVVRLTQVWWLEGLHPYQSDYWKPLLAGLTSVIVAKAAVAAAGLNPSMTSAILASVTMSVTYVALLC